MVGRLKGAIESLCGRGSRSYFVMNKDGFTGMPLCHDASKVYTALSRFIKDLGKSSPFRKTERGKVEAKIVAME